LTTLGPELFEELNARQHVGRRLPVVYGATGLSRRQVADIEAQVGFRLPDDFVFLFCNLQDPGRVLFQWHDFKLEAYEASIDYLWYGIAFDVEHNVWLDRWGTRPGPLSEALKIAREDFLTWPKLLPISGHRFLAAEPCRSGNPVFSIRQFDIIYYGADLAHYLSHEFLGGEHKTHTFDQKIQRVDVWSDIAEGNINPYVGYRP
jgi:hypothetical protein